MSNHHHDHHEHSHSHCQHVLTVRMHSGLSGDMMLAGLLKMANISEEKTGQLLASIMPELQGTLKLVRKEVNHIGGWHTQIDLPHQHEHRTLGDVLAIIKKSSMDARAAELAAKAFTLLAEAEAQVHGKNPEEVHFHEVGALDSILDICLSCALFAGLNIDRLVASPIPLADGHVHCMHGIIPVPAPAVLRLLPGMKVCPFPARGETITPTAAALLRAFNADFGAWPSMTVQQCALVYGTTVFEHAPNGATFALGYTD